MYLSLQVVSSSGNDSKTSSHSGSLENNNSSTNNVSVANGDSVSREDSGTGKISLIVLPVRLLN